MLGAAFLVSAWSGSGSSALAATFEWVGSELCDIRLSGEIAAGDTERLKAVIDENGQSNAPSSLCLDSLGSNYAEALRLIEFRLERSYAGQVIVERDADCLSACALVFLSGHWREAEFAGADRIMHPTSRVAFHAPFYRSVEDRAFDALEMAQSYRLAVRSIAELIGSTASTCFHVRSLPLHS